MASSVPVVGSENRVRSPLKVLWALFLGGGPGEKIVVIVAFCIAWQLVATFLETQVIPAPLAVAGAFYELMRAGTLLNDILTSLTRVFVGFLVAGTAGIVVGLACARVRSLHRLIQPIVECLRPIPPIAWIPLAVLWFGLGDASAVFLIALGVFFPIFTNTFLGFSSIDDQYVRAARVLGFGRWQFFADVLVRFAAPYIFAGARIGLGFGWMCVVAAEMLGATSGLGYMIQLNRVVFEVPNIIAGMITIGLIGFGINELMDRLEVRLLPWAVHD